MVALEGRKISGVVYILYDTLLNLLHLLENSNSLYCGRGSFVLFFFWTVLAAGKKVKKPLPLTSELVRCSIYDTVRKG